LARFHDTKKRNTDVDAQCGTGPASCKHCQPGTRPAGVRMLQMAQRCCY
jgi:hypothetical protein